MTTAIGDLCIYCEGPLDDGRDTTRVYGDQYDDAHIQCAEEEDKTTASTLFCPRCGQQPVVRRRGAFIEAGPYINGRYADEGEVSEYICQAEGCRATFYF